MSVIHIRSQGQFTNLKAKGKLIVKFGAKWCGPCRAIAPVFEQYASDPNYSTLIFVEVDIEVTPELAQMYDISGVPTFIVLDRGHVMDSFSGASQATLKRMITQHL
jgi:thioredoxin 1